MHNSNIITTANYPDAIVAAGGTFQTDDASVEELMITASIPDPSSPAYGIIFKSGSSGLVTCRTVSNMVRTNKTVRVWIDYTKL
jgi:hypothetical protein